MADLNISPAHAVNPRGMDGHGEQQAMAKAGTAFEALILKQLLTSARAGSSSGGGEWRDMADRTLAENLAEASPLGVRHILKETAR